MAALGVRVSGEEFASELEDRLCRRPSHLVAPTAELAGSVDAAVRRDDSEMDGAGVMPIGRTGTRHTRRGHPNVGANELSNPCSHLLANDVIDRPVLGKPALADR